MGARRPLATLHSEHYDTFFQNERITNLDLARPHALAVNGCMSRRLPAILDVKVTSTPIRRLTAQFEHFAFPALKQFIISGCSWVS